MKNMAQIRSILTFILGIVISTFLLGQSSEMKFKYITNEHGLSQSSAEFLFQDSYGFVWIGTRNGLNRYDGHEFKVFKPNIGDTTSISHYFVNSIIEDSSGFIWAGTFGGGLNKYDKHTEQFTQFKAEKFLYHGLTSNFINELFVDSKGIVWVATTEGLFSYVEENNTFKNLIIQDKGTRNPILSDIRAVFEDNLDQLWFASENKVYILDSENNLIKLISFDEGYDGNYVNHITDIKQDNEENKWLGSDIGLFRISFFSIENKTYNISYSPIYSDNHLITSISKIEVGNGIHANKLFIGSHGDGLISYNITTKNYTLAKPEKNVAKGLINNYVKSLLIDNVGLLWIGTEGGICIYNYLANTIKWYSSLPYNNNDIPLRNLHGIFEDAEDNLWLASKGDGLSFFNEKQKISQNYTYESTNGKLCSNNVRSIFQDSRGNYWIGYDDMGLGYIEGPQFNYAGIINFKDVENVPEGLKNGKVYDIIETQDQLVWFASEIGLHQFDYSSREFQSYYHDSKDASSISDNRVYCLFEDQHNMLWIGTFGGGLNKYDRQKGYFVSYKNDPEDDYSISGNDVTSIIDDPEGNLWLTFERGGVCHYNKASEKFTRIQESDGLSSNYTYSVLIDHQQNIWISGNNGLSHINLSDTTIINYTESDGLQSNEFNGGAGFIDEDGLVYLGGKSGLNIFMPEEIKPNKSIPKVVLTDFQLFNQSVHAGDKNNVLSKAIFDTDKIVLKHNQNHITFSFAALGHRESNKIRYSYILEGFMEEWIDIGNQHAVTFTNLNPDSYTLKINAASGEGVLSQVPLELEIIVQAPIWKTWWAYSIYFLILCLLIYGLVIRSRREMAGKSRIEIERISLQKTIELNELKLKFFTSISHELRTPVSLILGPLDNLLNEGRFSLKEMKQLQVMRKNALYLVGLLDNLMTFRKLEKGKMNLEVDQANLNDILDNCCSSFFSAAEMRNMEFSIDLPYEDLECWFDQNKIEMIMFNLLSNAIKYSKDGARISVKLSVLDRNKMILPASNVNEDTLKDKSLAQIEVSDTGMGIPKDKMKHVFDRFSQLDDGNQEYLTSVGIGLSIVKETVKLHKGKIKLESKVGQGSTFKIHIPISLSSFSEKDLAKKRSGQALPISGDSYISIPAGKKEDNDIVTDSNELLSDTQTGSRILIIDDNAELREFLVNSFDGDYVVESAVDGDDGLKKVRAKTPDLIISDILMPGKDGIEVCRTVRKEIPEYIPIILLTAKSAEDSKYQGYETGADAYIVKPFSINMLKMRVQKLLQSRKMLKSYFHTAEITNPEASNFTSFDERLLHKLVIEIEKNISNSEFSVLELAKSLGISRSHLFRKLKALSGQNPNEFIKSIRLNHAAQLLTKKKYSVSEIAYHVGFNDPKYFGKCFRQKFEMSPTEYSHQHLVES